MIGGWFNLLHLIDDLGLFELDSMIKFFVFEELLNFFLKLENSRGENIVFLSFRFQAFVELADLFILDRAFQTLLDLVTFSVPGSIIELLISRRLAFLLSEEKGFFFL